MKTIRFGIAVALVLVMIGCSGGGSDGMDSQGDSRVPDDNVFSDQVRSLEKAESVEGMVLQGSADRDKAIEQQAR